jgi:hypothetical protein
VTIDWEALAAFKNSPEYRSLGVLARERLLYATFPELALRHRALTARHLEAAVWGDPPSTPDPDDEGET